MAAVEQTNGNGETGGQAEIVGEGLATIADAQAFLKLSRSAIYGLMETGQLPYVKLGRCRRIPRRALTALAAAGLVAR
jgi:excisionase family DNA binding protein